MFDVPTVRPETTPDEDPMVATVGALLLHVPPPVALNKFVVNPIQTLVVPVIAGGFGLTVTDAVVAQPVGKT